MCINKLQGWLHWWRVYWAQLIKTTTVRYVCVCVCVCVCVHVRLLHSVSCVHQHVHTTVRLFAGVVVLVGAVWTVVGCLYM